MYMSELRLANGVQKRNELFVPAAVVYCPTTHANAAEPASVKLTLSGMGC